MKERKFALSWRRSQQPRKQRLFRRRAPLHIKQKFMHVHLSPELRKKYSLRNIQLRKGDKVRVLRGEFKKKEGKVDKIDLKREKVFITGIERVRKEGTKLPVPFHPSQLMILELNLEDKKRRQKLSLKLEKAKELAEGKKEKKTKTEQKTKQIKQIKDEKTP